MGNCAKPAAAPIALGEETPTQKKKKVKLSRAQKEVDAVLNHLSCPTSAVHAFLKFFKDMDKDASGTIDLQEFITVLGLEAWFIPFIERCFGAMDFNKSGGGAGSLDPTEFTVGLYNLCIMTSDLLCAYVFDMYQVRNDGNLYKAQVVTLVTETTSVAAAVPKLVDDLFKKIDKDHDGHISKNELVKLSQDAGSVLLPMFRVQEMLRTKCMGTKFWDEERVRMQNMLEEFKEKTIIDLLANRISAKAEAERRKKMEDAGVKEGDEKKVKDRALVKGFSEKAVTGPGGKGTSTAATESNAKGPIFAKDLKEAEDKKKQKQKEIDEKEGKKPKKKKEAGPALSVKGASKQVTASSSYAMKHKAELSDMKK